ncbi:MAG: hypothetical protein NTX87_02725 [Planctomycetota bacterium]|nr:hypothetical protein [Planctomycetota bacterium]
MIKPMVGLEEGVLLDRQAIARRLRDIAVQALKRMYLPEQRVFAFRIRRSGSGDQLEGVSHRYTAIVLLGLTAEPDRTACDILAGHTVHEVCDRLIGAAGRATDVGEAALTLWAARALNHTRADEALRRLQSLDPPQASCPTAELSWCLSALTVPGSEVAGAALAEAIARRLLASFHSHSAMFPHWPVGAKAVSLRSHVACFADLVYPIQALSYFYMAARSLEALNAARLCAARMCELQGPAGQWWWHYDVRTGRVIEGYPVYAVHQEAMAPMVLFALQKACGLDHSEAIAKGLQWLINPPEIAGSLIDDEAGIIWRKVARQEPLKMSRTVRALASRLHPALRMQGLDLMFPPTFVDYESRPYEMGWILHAWPNGCA